MMTGGGIDVKEEARESTRLRREEEKKLEAKLYEG